MFAFGVVRCQEGCEKRMRKNQRQSTSDGVVAFNDGQNPTERTQHNDSPVEKRPQVWLTPLLTPSITTTILEGNQSGTVADVDTSSRRLVCRLAVCFLFLSVWSLFNLGLTKAFLSDFSLADPIHTSPSFSFNHEVLRPCPSFCPWSR